jgi:hypothetical protein
MRHDMLMNDAAINQNMLNEFSEHNLLSIERIELLYDKVCAFTHPLTQRQASTAFKSRLPLDTRMQMVRAVCAFVECLTQLPTGVLHRLLPTAMRATSAATSVSPRVSLLGKHLECTAKTVCVLHYAHITHFSWTRSFATPICWQLSGR